MATIVLGADPVGGATRGSDDVVLARIRGFLTQAADISHGIGDGMHEHMEGGGEPISALGLSVTHVLQSTLQTSWNEEQSDPLMQSMQHDHPELYAHHVHAVQKADLALQTVSSLLGTLEHG
ncbi:hypothetical protein KFE25_011070 [Diacronema lutheri]|uniref:Uncharacterized protein n=1 Tax=Diacronema lutheri TaxID=2081491 RepID=A0A8J5X7C4_DIALT|nr:hypothetical protein KFE25_011070 [Diacronema lutheri]